MKAIEDRLDPLPNTAESGHFVLAVHADQMCAEVLGDEPREITTEESLITQDELVLEDQPVIAFKQRLVAQRPPSLGLAQTPDGRHAIVVLIRWSRKPQKNREWEAQ